MTSVQFMGKLMFKQYDKELHTNTQCSQMMHSEGNAISNSSVNIISIIVQPTQMCIHLVNIFCCLFPVFLS